MTITITSTLPAGTSKEEAYRLILLNIAQSPIIGDWLTGTIRWFGSTEDISYEVSL